MSRLDFLLPAIANPMRYACSHPDLFAVHDASDSRPLDHAVLKCRVVLRGKVVALLFFEDSTRTRMSFELAASRLSADTLLFTAKGSSVAKGETTLDTVRNIEAMGVDIFVIRHAQSVRRTCWPHGQARRSSTPATASRSSSSRDFCFSASRKVSPTADFRPDIIASLLTTISAPPIPASPSPDAIPPRPERRSPIASLRRVADGW